MAVSVYKRGKKWRADVRKGGIARTKTFDHRLVALAWAEETLHDLSSGDQILLGKTVRDAFKRYQREVSPRKAGHRWEVVRLNKFSREPWTAGQLSMLTADHLQRWVDMATVSPGTVLRDLNLIQSVLEVARKKWKWIKTNPAVDVDKPQRPQPRDRRISDEEIKAVLAALGYTPEAKIRGCAWENGHAFLLALETAMRRGEIWNLDWSDVYLEKKYLTLRKTKNGTTRDVPLSSRAVDLLKQMSPQNEGRVFRTVSSSAESVFRSKIKKAGIQNLRFHDTRHEALTRLAGKLEVLELARMVGHRDLRSLMVYYIATAQELANKLG